MTRVLIESRKTGEQYSVTPADFRRLYEEQGFRIVSAETGEPYKAERQTAEARK